MIVRGAKKNTNGTFDFMIGQGFTSYKKGEKAIEQDIETSLLEFKNDCFFALNNGIDWRTRLGSKNQKSLLDKDIIEIIKSKEGVLDITEFRSVLEERTYTCNVRVVTIYSDDLNFNFSKNI